MLQLFARKKLALHGCGVLGTKGAGKTSAINALFGLTLEIGGTCHKRTSDVRSHPITKGLSVVEIPEVPKFLPFSMLGIFRANADILIYLIEPMERITDDLKADLQSLRADGRPLLVLLTKMDTVPPHLRREFIERRLKVAEVPRSDMYAVAFAPHPELSPEPINVQPVRDWIDRVLRLKQGEALR